MIPRLSYEDPLNGFWHVHKKRQDALKAVDRLSIALPGKPFSENIISAVREIATKFLKI